MMSYEEFLKDPDDVWEFRTQYCGVFKKDNRARQSLNNTLETNFVAVYRSEDCYKDQWKTDKINWDSETFYVVTASGKIISIMNSEWATMGVAK